MPYSTIAKQLTALAVAWVLLSGNLPAQEEKKQEEDGGQEAKPIPKEEEPAAGVPEGEYLELARGRNYAAAISAAPDEEVKEGLTKAAAFLDIVLDELSWGDRKISYWDPSGRSKRVKGKILQLLPKRIQVQTRKEIEFVELAEIQAACCFDVFRDRLRRVKDRDRDKEKGEMAAWFLIFEGEPDLARRAIGKFEERIPQKWWDYADALGAQLVEKRKNDAPDKDVLKAEEAARELFYAAILESQKRETMGAAIGKYKELLANHAETRFVKENLETIRARGPDAGKRILLLPSDATKAEGLWRLKEIDGGVAPKVWWAARDPEDDNYAESPLEFAFWARNDIEYTVYMRAYVCCNKVVSGMLFQATALKLKDANGKDVMADLSTNMSGRMVPPKGLTETDPHDLKMHKWVWIPMIRKQKWTGTGVKDVRITTEIGDVAISHLLLIAAGSGLPESEEALEKMARNR